ncbi:hypothetical protein AGLY_011474 [Aphis glycines]|uniref:Uncharacterized protein n=1 Tax=Aphis glycines TaxID=307491 RepID=A0A6G0TDV0_APHGL|nr:hypothetical protein AGLY_011474 [Aphis glycines]
MHQGYSLFHRKPPPKFEIEALFRLSIDRDLMGDQYGATHFPSLMADIYRPPLYYKYKIDHIGVPAEAHILRMPEIFFAQNRFWYTIIYHSSKFNTSTIHTSFPFDFMRRMLGMPGEFATGCHLYNNKNNYQPNAILTIYHVITRVTLNILYVNSSEFIFHYSNKQQLWTYNFEYIVQQKFQTLNRKYEKQKTPDLNFKKMRPPLFTHQRLDQTTGSRLEILYKGSLSNTWNIIHNESPALVKRVIYRVRRDQLIY